MTVSDLIALKEGLQNKISHFADGMNADAVRRWKGFLETVNMLESEIERLTAEIELLQSECHEYREALRGLCACAQLGPMTVCPACKALSYYDDPPLPKGGNDRSDPVDGRESS